MNYLFDGTFLGFLCCIFESFERREEPIVPLLKEDYQNALFFEPRAISTDEGKATRVLKGLQSRVGKAEAMDFYRVFLSEDRKAWQASLYIMRHIFKGDSHIRQNYGDDQVLYFSQTLKKVGRERHRMKAFVRFSKSSDGMYVALVEPDFNVLPLIAGFFQKRYADMPWLIYDVKRKYGLHYDGLRVTEVKLRSEELPDTSLPEMTINMDDRDAFFQHLWKQYYTSTNIEARKNLKLHLQHVPRRYWKYLPEKQ